MLTGDIGEVCVHHSTEVVLEISDEVYVQLTIFHVTTRMAHPMLYTFYQLVDILVMENHKC